MKNEFINTTSLICTEEMLSSSTYYSNSDQHCIYCHKKVTNNNIVIWDGSPYQPYRCLCEKAQWEVFLKQEILYKLKELKKLNDSVNGQIIRDAIDKDEAAMADEYKNMKIKEKI